MILDGIIWTVFIHAPLEPPRTPPPPPPTHHQSTHLPLSSLHHIPPMLNAQCFGNSLLLSSCTCTYTVSAWYYILFTISIIFSRNNRVLKSRECAVVKVTNCKFHFTEGNNDRICSFLYQFFAKKFILISCVLRFFIFPWWMLKFVIMSART